MSQESGAQAPLRITGALKFFNHVKGYGFVTPDPGSPVASDVMVHITVLKACGFRAPADNASLTLDVIEGEKGLQASAVLEVSSFAAEVVTLSRPSTLRRRMAERASVDFAPAALKWFNRHHGYGFVRVDGIDEDVFLHAETVNEADFKELEPGQPMEVRYGEGPKGLTVVAVRPCGSEALRRGEGQADVPDGETGEKDAKEGGRELRRP